MASDTKRSPVDKAGFALLGVIVGLGVVVWQGKDAEQAAAAEIADLHAENARLNKELAAAKKEMKACADATDALTGCKKNLGQLSDAYATLAKDVMSCVLKSGKK